MQCHLRCVVLFLLLSARLLYAQSERDILKIFEQGYEAYQQGKYEEALSSYEHSLRMARGKQFRKGITVNLIGTGFIYGLLGRYDKAFPLLEEALTVARELKLPHEVAVCLHSLGAVYFFSGQYDKALAHFEKALQLPQGFTLPREVALGRNSLGVAYGSLGEYDRALESFHHVIQMSQQLSTEEVATALNNIATVYLWQQRYPEAEQTSLKAEQLWKKTRTPERGKAVLVEVYLATHRYEEALTLLRESPQSWRDSDNDSFEFHVRQGLALRGSGRLPEAASALLKAFSLGEEMRHRISQQPDRLDFFGFSSRLGRIRAYRALVATLAERALRGEVADPAFAPYGQSMAAYAFYFAEAAKARVLLETMAESARKLEGVNLPPEIRLEEANLREQLFALDDQWARAYQRGEAALKTLQEKKQKLIRDRHDLIVRLRRDYPRYAALYYPQPVPPEALPLKAHEVLLEYALGEDATYLFRVRKGHVDKVWRLPVSKAELERQVTTLLQPLQQPGGKGMSAFAPLLGHNLYRLLLAEALQDLPPGTQLMIVPDGILGLLPFETLVITPGKDIPDTRFVGETWQLHYYQSATVFAFLRMLAPSVAPKPFFALGHPIYDPQDPRYVAYLQGKPLPSIPAQALNSYAYRGFATQRTSEPATRGSRSAELLNYPPLPDTESEVKTIASLFGTPPEPPDVLLHLAANETRLLQTPLSRYRYLHFATHADLSDALQGIKEPFLLLGQVENDIKLGEDKGLLTLTKVRRLRERLDADMVVLSACVTGHGLLREGEGVVNFVHAFHHAGARSVVVSLWEVSSNVAAEYMERFYQHLRAGKSKAEALFLARKEIKVRRPNPFHWAPFILHGEG